MIDNAQNVESKPKSGSVRYRAYFWLMDICFVFSVIGILEFILTRNYGRFPEGAEPGWYTVLAITAVLISFFVAPLLILARFMRDEYAEQLWKRTTNVIVMVVTGGLYVLFFAAWVVWFFAQTEKAPFPFSLFMVETVWWVAITNLWKTFCLLFVAIFEFLRWKDSR